jgi:hypothetical protein
MVDALRCSLGLEYVYVYTAIMRIVTSEYLVDSIKIDCSIAQQWLNSSYL